MSSVFDAQFIYNYYILIIIYYTIYICIFVLLITVVEAKNGTAISNSTCLIDTHLKDILKSLVDADAIILTVLIILYIRTDCMRLLCGG